MIFAVFWIRIRTFDSGSGSGQDSQTYADPDPQHGVQTLHSHLLVLLSSLSLLQGPPLGLPRTAPRLRLTGCLRRFLHSPLHPVWARPSLKAVRENFKGNFVQGIVGLLKSFLSFLEIFLSSHAPYEV